MGLFTKKNSPKPIISAVIVAAGLANRMDGVDKQQILLDDAPVIVHSICALSQCDEIEQVVVVCRQEQIPEFYAMVVDYGLSKVSSVVSGGATRQSSVFLGIDACRKDTQFYVIHDGARPLITPWHVQQCIKAALAIGAAAVGVPVKDTIKICDSNAKILSTPDRNYVFAVQTPQIFEAQLYHKAMKLACERGLTYTDDCQLVENAGYPVFITPGSDENIKITTPQDLILAQIIIANRLEGER